VLSIHLFYTFPECFALPDVPICPTAKEKETKNELLPSKKSKQKVGLRKVVPSKEKVKTKGRRKSWYRILANRIAQKE